MSHPSKSLSIVIPVYNEEQRLSKTFSSLEEFLKQHHFYDIEIIFVDDGSTDKTREIIKKFSDRIILNLISYPKNKGKGYAVVQGMMAAKNDYALICDADMSTPLAEITNFISLMTEDVPVIIGTRKAKGAHVSKPQSIIRRNLGRCYTLIADLITGLRVSDFTCGFKLFSRHARKLIFPKLKIERWSYDAEILFLAKLNHLPIKEVPVRWHNDENTRVRLGRDIFSSFIDLWRIRFGKYS